MHGVKVLIFVAIVGAIGVLGLFIFSPDTRPPIVKKWFRQAMGFGPAKTPTEALDKFRDAIKKRDYETAAEYTDKDYREQVLKVAKGAKKLGDAIDSLEYNMDKQGVVSKKAQHILYLLEPFPKSFKVLDIKESSGGDSAVAKIADDSTQFTSETMPDATFLTRNGNMIKSLVPLVDLAQHYDTVELFKEAGFWKIKFGVTPRLRITVEALKDSATNYANGILQVRDEVKNDHVTKGQIERELEQRIGDSR
jgi:hypothetical protein